MTLLQDVRLDTDKEFLGDKGVQGFKTFLIKRFGSLVNGWRVLDKDGNGHLSFGELCGQLRMLGYHGNLKKLWEELDANGSGAVSLMEVDYTTGYYVGTFKRALYRKYGDMLKGWQECIDISGDGRIQEQEIVDAVKRLELDLNGKKLFRMLVGGRKGLGLTLKDFDPESWHRYVTGDIHGLLSKPRMEFLEDLDDDSPEEAQAQKESDRKARSGALRRFRKQIMDAEKAAQRKADDDISRMRAGLYTAEGFKAALSNRCGSLLGAWRQALDLDGNGRLTFGEFCQALKRLAFFGEVKSLWNQLKPSDRDYILFSDLDPDTDAQLADLQSKLKDKYGNMLLAWTRGMDTMGSGCVNEKAFVDACQKVGFQGKAKKLFRVMQPDATRRFLTLKDFDTQAYQALSRADFRMLSESDAPNADGRSPLQMSFHERQESGFYWNIRRAWDKAEQDEFARACRFNTKDFVIDSVEEFETLCRRNFGSMMGAWRLCLDSDHNGKLTFNEWCAALRRVGYSGDLKALFKKYDKDKKGYILIKDIDPAADHMINSFLATLAEKYGTIDNAWTRGFHKDPHEAIDKGNLREAAAHLGWEGNVDELFRNLQPMPGRVLLSIWDLDPECSRKRARGDAPLISSPRKPVTSPEEERRLRKFGTRSALSPEHTAGSLGSRAQSAGALLENSMAPIEKLRKALRNHYGSTLAAWRAGLDPKLSGQTSFGTFVLVVNECALPRENVKGMWDELCNGAGKVSFEDIDQEAYQLLGAFRESLLGSSSCLTRAWRELLDVPGLQYLSEDAFVEACRHLSRPVRKPAKLFRLLLPRASKKQVCLEDLRALLLGVPAPDRAEVWGGTEPAAAPPSPQEAEQLRKQAPYPSVVESRIFCGFPDFDLI
ncbi:unnamed protein product [Prorocentrum cordatum]|uniref:EF-hand domain-containing protein n=1 Tax=Prorocentrum cordatum TaxID=2364126 RepID=A0ABN9U1D7_9DINO|nr:unnamed protein product [Polarella glacialis]